MSWRYTVHLCYTHDRNRFHIVQDPPIEIENSRIPSMAESSRIYLKCKLAVGINMYILHTCVDISAIAVEELRRPLSLSYIPRAHIV
jgi:hypothetical protein